MEPQKSRRAAVHFDLEDSVILKGLAILAIVLHNYFHLVADVKENEFTFDVHRTLLFVANLGYPDEFIETLFSFLGHFGVQIFIFLSAYGLTMRGESEKSLAWPEFMRQRMRKIYPAFAAGVVIWALFVGWPQGWLGPMLVLYNNLAKILLTGLGVLTLIPCVGRPPVGPWWFVPFILQFYALWPLVIRVHRRFGRAGLSILALTCLALTQLGNDYLVKQWSINLLKSPIGHMSEICLGVALARYGFSPGKILTAMAAVAWLACSLHRELWLFSFLCALVFMLCLYLQMKPLLRRIAFFRYLGQCSLALFLVNGFVRIPFFGLMSHHWLPDLLLTVFGTMVAILLARLVTVFLSASAQYRSSTNYGHQLVGS